jgi:hypothetical protein
MYDAHVQEFTKFWNGLVVELYTRHKPLLVYLARKFVAARLGAQFDVEEAISEMTEPICRSAQVWRPERGVPFRLFAAKFLWRDVKKYAAELIGPTWKQMPEIYSQGQGGHRKEPLSHMTPDHRRLPGPTPLAMWCGSSERRAKMPWLGRIATYLRLVEGYGLADIADVFGFTKERARQHYRKTLLRLGIDLTNFEKVYFRRSKCPKKSA